MEIYPTQKQFHKPFGYRFVKGACMVATYGAFDKGRGDAKKSTQCSASQEAKAGLLDRTIEWLTCKPF